MLVSNFKMKDWGESINQILLLSGALLLYSVFSFVLAETQTQRRLRLSGRYSNLRSSEAVNHFLISDKIPP